MVAGWQQLQGRCYALLNQLVESSCVGVEQQLLVVPLAVGEVLEAAVAQGGVLTGGWGYKRPGGGEGEVATAGAQGARKRCL